MPLGFDLVHALVQRLRAHAVVHLGCNALSSHGLIYSSPTSMPCFSR